ncbi:MAG TPA: hypothetical protein VFB50_20370, partial [Chloroflexota bacterium]|nr:hypothetical protein [Chloroflexota bacterium]
MPHLVHKSAVPVVTRVGPRARVALGVAVAAATAALLTIVLSVDLLPRVYEVHEGDVAALPIKAPGPISYISQVRTRTARDAAAAQVQPIYDLDRDLIARQTRGLADLI